MLLTAIRYYFGLWTKGVRHYFGFWREEEILTEAWLYWIAAVPGEKADQMERTCTTTGMQEGRRLLIFHTPDPDSSGTALQLGLHMSRQEPVVQEVRFDSEADLVSHPAQMWSAILAKPTHAAITVAPPEVVHNLLLGMKNLRYREVESGSVFLVHLESAISIQLI